MVLFFTSIACSSDNSLIHRLSANIDKLFYFGGRKAEMLSISGREITVKMIDGEKLSWKESAIKILCLALVLLPAMIWKAVYRNYYTVKVVPGTQPVSKPSGHVPDFSRLTDSHAVMEIQTYSGKHSAKNFFQNEYGKGVKNEFGVQSSFAVRMVGLGDKLDNDFYIIRARGGGNCFYLSYLCGLLYLSASNHEVYAKALEKLKSTPLYPILQKIHRVGYVEEVLENNELIEDLIQSLRFFAVDQIKNIPEEAILMYCLHSGNDELAKIQTRAEYVEKVKKSGENAQQLEINLLSEQLIPVEYCYANQAFRHTGFISKNLVGKICLLQRDNHFDVLIGKDS